jgi:hypothetical protein
LTSIALASKQPRQEPDRDHDRSSNKRRRMNGPRDNAVAAIDVSKINQEEALNDKVTPLWRYFLCIRYSSPF